MNAIPPRGFDPSTAEQVSIAIDPPPEEPVRPAAAQISVPPHLSAIEVTLSVEVGSQRLTLADLLAVEPGQLFQLDRMTAEPVDILVNGRRFGRGEVVAMGDRYGVRLTALSDAQD